MATDPHAEHEKPSDWGWHAEFGGGARFAGWFCLLLLVVMLTSTHYNHSGSLWLILGAAALFVVLVWDRYRRKFSWRK